ncbi:hypothetical protein GCM10023144_21600 [Pigmentiphaga soli]|uniref:PIN domain-containing protein n=1 Tax=Pigmentiphaga soli TaxID=1007095 RepID=A0ABP8GZ36_9BURK
MFADFLGHIVVSNSSVCLIEPPADPAYGLIRTRLEQAGTPIGGKDLLIAAQALALGFTIVTDNEAGFARIDGLPWKNGLRPAS